jgi:hypothetical protein
MIDYNEFLKISPFMKKKKQFKLIHFFKSIHHLRVVKSRKFGLKEDE